MNNIDISEPGLCGCGCGYLSPISTVNNAQRGYVKGQPMRFIHGHHNKLQQRRGGAPGGVLYDAEDQWIIDLYTWRISSQGYAQANRRVAGRNLPVFLHRLILGDKPGFVVDHINRNRLDNRRCNLRHVTLHENIANRAVRYCSKTGRRGVSLLKSGRFWAYGNVNGKRFALGTYGGLDQAAEVARAWRLANLPGAVD